MRTLWQSDPRAKRTNYNIGKYVFATWTKAFWDLSQRSRPSHLCPWTNRNGEIHTPAHHGLAGCAEWARVLLDRPAWRSRQGCVQTSRHKLSLLGHCRSILTLRIQPAYAHRKIPTPPNCFGIYRYAQASMGRCLGAAYGKSLALVASSLAGST